MSESKWTAMARMASELKQLARLASENKLMSESWLGKMNGMKHLVHVLLTSTEKQTYFWHQEERKAEQQSNKLTDEPKSVL